MPHYSDGTEAKVGDIVKGTGYNVKHEIIGKVLSVTAAESCNVTIAYVGKDTPVYRQQLSDGSMSGATKVEAGHEYGACKDFLKIAVLFIAAMLASVLTATAGEWTRLHGDVYSDGTWAYRAYYDCGWHYDKLYRILPDVTKVGFWDEALRFEGNLELESGRREYLEKRYPHVGGVGYSGYGTAVNGVSIAQQGIAPGYAASGTTFYGVASGYQPQQIDVNSAIARAQRLVEQVNGAAQAAEAGATQLVAQAVDGNTAEAKIRAAGDVTVAAIRATQEAKTTVTQFESHPQYPSGATGARPDPPSDDTLPSQPQPNQGSRVELDRTYAMAQLGFQSCSKCHATSQPKAGLLLTESNFASLSDDGREDLAKHVLSRTDHRTPKGKRMPLDGEQTPDTVREAMAFMIRHPRNVSSALSYN